MQSEVSEISPVLMEVTVRVPWDRVQKDLDQTYRELGRSARVRGFRPGKVPRNVLQQVYGKRVDGEVMAQIVEAGLLAAVQQHALDIVAEPSVDAPALEKGKEYTFKAKVEVRPKVDEVDTSKLEIVRPSAEVDGAAIDQEIERLRREHAAVRVPEPMRPAVDGDELTIDYRVEIDGEDKPDMAAEGRPVELGADSLIPEFERALGGVVPGDTRDIEVAFADDHNREDLRGKKAVFRVHVKELREKLLPDVDDELAKDVGDYQTLLELRLKIREELETMAKRRAEAELKEALIDKLVDTNDVPAPPSMVQAEERRVLTELMQLFKMTGGGPGLDPSILGNIRERAERKVKAAILLGALARKQGFEVTPAEVESRLAEIAETSGKHIAKVRVEYQGERAAALESQLLEEKLMDYLGREATDPGRSPGRGGSARRWRIRRERC